MKIFFKRVSANENGDYYQVSFETKDAEDEPHVLIQRQFEDPDGGVCYVETHDVTYCGHAQVKSASIFRNRFCLERIVISNGHSVSKAKYRMVARLSLAS